MVLMSVGMSVTTRVGTQALATLRGCRAERVHSELLELNGTTEVKGNLRALVSQCHTHTDKPAARPTTTYLLIKRGQAT